MKKLQLLAVLLSFAAFTLFGCAEDSAELMINWESDSRGTLEIVNTSNQDIVLFLGERPTSGSILGGVRAGKTKNLNICAHPEISDCINGGWAIIRGITRDVYNDNIHDLTKVTKIDFSAMANYHITNKYRIRIDYDYVGDNAVRLVNNGRVGIELRKDSPEGEKVAYLPAMQVNQMLYTQSTSAITLFPYYVIYDKSSKTVTTLKATDMTQSVMVGPRPISNPQAIPTAYFPNDAADSWAKILGTLKSPVAYVSVENGIMGQAVYFTNSGSTRYHSQNGFADAINAGEEKLVFEVAAVDAVYTKDEKGNDTEEIIGGGTFKNLVILAYGGTVKVPVKSTDENLNDDILGVKIYNGYEYVINVSGSTSTGYKAIITMGAKRDLSGNIEDIHY